MPRHLSIWFPRLGAERWLRLGACPVGQPLVTVGARGGTVASASAAAAAVGLDRGMTLEEAFDRYPGLVVLPADEAAEAVLLSAMARAARGVGWTVEPEPPDGLSLGIGPLESEVAIVAQALSAASASGFSARPGVADTAPAARILARHGLTGGSGPGRIAAPGRTREALLPLPVEALDLSRPALRRLERLGVRAIAEIADWPDPALRRYLGAEVADRLGAALGREVAMPDLAPFGEGVVAFAGNAGPRRSLRSA